MSQRSTIKRLPERAATDRAVINSILDEAMVCHVGFVDEGSPFVIPTIHARVEDTLYMHGSPASRMLRLMKGGAEVCVTVTLLDGIVAARSVFHHSYNYRSVMLFGHPRPVVEDDERWTAMRAITEHVLPGRWSDARHPSRNEDKGTLIVALAIAEKSAKVRTGPPEDEDEDYRLPVWAGVIPLSVVPGTPQPDPRLAAGIVTPEYVTRYRRPGSDPLSR